MNEIMLEKDIILISNQTIVNLFNYENWSDVVALYMFYHKQCKLQWTNQSFTVWDFVMKWLRWWDKRFGDAKKVLKELNLIEDISQRDDKGKVVWWFIKLNYLQSFNKANLSTTSETHTLAVSTGGWQGTNALSKKLEMLKVEKENASETTIICSNNTTIKNDSLNNNDIVKDNTKEVASLNCNTLKDIIVEEEKLKINVEYQIFQNYKSWKECDCNSKSTWEKCKRKSTYNIDWKNYCNQHSREKIWKYLNNTKYKKDEIENRDDVFEKLYNWYAEKWWKKDAKAPAKKWFDKFITKQIHLDLLRYALPKYIESVKDKQYLVLLRTYLSEQRYLDFENEFKFRTTIDKWETHVVEKPLDDFNITYKRQYNN